jgi:mRNA-degrading endonuclease RelE of RelBE toxin-antitoxin system
MTSAVLPSFWREYRNLDPLLRPQVRKAYRLWLDNPFHPSLRFKCINRADNIWAVRVTRGYRAVGVVDGDVATWFWIGSHDEYEHFFG